jgi:hypothetical protein
MDTAEPFINIPRTGITEVNTIHQYVPVPTIALTVEMTPGTLIENNFSLTIPVPTIALTVEII